MDYCIQCGREIHWWRRILRDASGRSAVTDGVDVAGLHLCGDACKFSYVANFKAQRLQKKEMKELRRKERTQQSKERRETEIAKVKASNLQQAEKARSERAKSAKERRATEAATQRRQERALEVKKRPFLETVKRNPQDPMAYSKLADFLLKGSGLGKVLGKLQESNPTQIGGVMHLSVLGDSASERFLLLFDPDERGRLKRKLKLKRHRQPLNEAKDAYFRAIALGPSPGSYTTASQKLTYVLISGLLSAESPEKESFPGEANHYAREAERDLRSYLRNEPDNVPALQILGLAIALYQRNERVREQRIASVTARIAEAQTREQLRSVPQPGLRAPGAPDSPYPDDWSDLSNAVKRRDSYRCTNCEAVDVEIHVHHIVPLSQGGSNEMDNLVTLCDICHREEHSSG